MSVGMVSLDVVNEVYVGDEYVPLTGVFATEESISGWRWDRRRLESSNDDKTRFGTFLGGHEVGLKDGTQRDQWQSGTINGIKYQGITRYRNLEDLSWTPVVSTGSYASYFDPRPLYSDYSYSEIFNPANNQNGVNLMELREDVVESTISVALWERTDDFHIFHKYAFDAVDEFTGEIQAGARVDVEDDNGVITWSDIETRKREFIVRDGVLYLNGDYQVTVGPFVTGALASEYDDLYEYHGNGNEAGRDLYLRMFPVLEGSVRLFVKTAGVMEEWTETGALELSESTDKHFKVDHDLGIITIGGWEADPLVLSENINDTVDEIPVFPDLDTLQEYGEWGIIQIGSEKIFYGERSPTALSQCVRGYDGTVAASHTLGDLVEDMQHGYQTTSADDLYVSYVAVPRAEYEVTTHELRSANTTGWLDINPNHNISASNIFQLKSNEPHLDSIVLATDSPVIGGNLYGPVYFGVDTSFLTATALDTNGSTVEGIELTISITAGSGQLNSSGTSFSGTTNTDGEMYSFYNAPYSGDSIYHEVANVTHGGGDTTMLVSTLPVDVKADEITVFQVLKHDKLIGTQGMESSVETAVTGDADRGIGRYLITHRVSDIYEGGTLQVLGTNAVKYTMTITSIYDTESAGVPVSYVYTDTDLGGVLADGQPCWLLESQSEQWDENDLNGVKVLLYEWDALTPHPITELPGAYIPVRPDTAALGVLTFDSRLLPVPAPTDTSSNLGAYVVVAPMVVTLIATGTDPVSGRTITSNTIRLLVDFPRYLTGMDDSGALPIPYGFTFITDEFNVGAGLGGANFLTINPRASGINTFSILSEV